QEGREHLVAGAVVARGPPREDAIDPLIELERVAAQRDLAALVPLDLAALEPAREGRGAAHRAASRNVPAIASIESNAPGRRAVTSIDRPRISSRNRISSISCSELTIWVSSSGLWSVSSNASTFAVLRRIQA